jgi:hypothetical protein
MQWLICWFSIAQLCIEGPMLRQSGSCRAPPRNALHPVRYRTPASVCRTCRRWRPRPLGASALTSAANGCQRANPARSPRSNKRRAARDEQSRRAPCRRYRGHLDATRKGADAASDKPKYVAKCVVRADEHIDEQLSLAHGCAGRQEIVWPHVNLSQAIGGSQAAWCQFVRFHVEALSVSKPP